MDKNIIRIIIMKYYILFLEVLFIFNQIFNSEHKLLYFKKLLKY